MLFINMYGERNKKKFYLLEHSQNLKNPEIYGGQLTVCKLLAKSELRK